MITYSFLVVKTWSLWRVRWVALFFFKVWNVHATSPSSDECHPKMRYSVEILRIGVRYYPYKWEYTPGICASSMDCGRGLSHLSGFHSFESNPHNAGFLFDARMETVISVPLGTCSSFNVCPSVPLIGDDKGKIVSRRTLIVESGVWMGIIYCVNGRTLTFSWPGRQGDI